jgi:uncharacterized protein YqcC (DUF446 family)
MHSDVYALVATKAKEIEAELKRLNRWTTEPLPPECFENMGAFGSNTMAFEQWIQFVLIPRIQEIITTKGEFPGESHLSAYAIRVFDGDTHADYLHELLYQLDTLINTPETAIESKREIPKPQDAETPPSLIYGSSIIPEVVYTLIEVLPQFSGDDLEAQLQTYDMFLYNLSSTVRQQIADLLEGAAAKTTDEVSRLRIQQAAKSVAEGGRAAAPYNHEEAMKKYQEEHKKSFPDQ